MLPFAVVNGSQIVEGPLANACPTVSSRLPFQCNGASSSATDCQFLLPPHECTRSEPFVGFQRRACACLAKAYLFQESSKLNSTVEHGDCIPWHLSLFPSRQKQLRSIVIAIAALEEVSSFPLVKSKSKFNGIDGAPWATNQFSILEVLHQISIACTKQPRMAH